MNPFAAHSQNMKAYEQMLAEPVNGQEGNYVLVGGARYTAVVGQFVVTQVFVNGGFSPMLAGEAIIQKDILPEGFAFRKRDRITAVQVGGESHDCIVDAAHGDYAEWRLQLWDASEGV